MVWPRRRRPGPSSRFFDSGGPAHLLGAYAALTLVMTWPLARGLAHDVPGDLGDSLLNLWILGWGAEQIPLLAAGRVSLSDYWNANIFHPEPLALGFSEHLFGQAIQILPVYYLTGNLILCYNLLFLASYVLSGYGVYLLARDLIGGTRAFSWPAFIAGLFFAFVPLRIAQVAHLQSLSTHWMPLALVGFRRFLAADPARSSRLVPLAAGSAALLLQNWSCGYYLVYFAPFVIAFIVHQAWVLGRLGNWRTWRDLAVAAGIVAAGTWPFLSLYLAARQVHGFERSLAEVTRFSADVYSYLTAPAALRSWGQVLQTYPKPEGELFLGFVPMLLAAIAVVASVAGSVSTASSHGHVPRVGSLGRWIARAAQVVLVVQAIGLAGLIATGGFVTSVFGVPVRATSPNRLITGIALVAALWLVASASARQRASAWIQSPVGIAVALVVAAVWLSLGPLAQSRGRAMPGLGVYGWFYEFVPGFDGLRVPARYSMIAALFLSLPVAFGARALLGRWPARPIGGLVAGALLIEAAVVPLPLNLAWDSTDTTLPARVEPAASAPAVYRWVASTPTVRVLAELPFGDPAHELRAVYYSTVHWRRLVNGYSGGFPRSYLVRAARLQRIGTEPDAAWLALREPGTTHVILHRTAYSPDEVSGLTGWLESHGARVVARFDDAVVFALPE